MPSPDALAHISSVLIVDDSRVQRSHTAALCKELGVAHIDEAGNGQYEIVNLAPDDGGYAYDVNELGQIVLEDRA